MAPGSGEVERSFEWLERAYEQRDPRLPLVNVGSFSQLSSDPRFADLLRRIGLPGG